MHNLEEVELIIGNSGKNFSGVTSITIQLLSYQCKEINLAVLGSSFIPNEFTTINFHQFIKLTRNNLANGKNRIFFTRRNDEMIQGLIAKYVFGSKIKIIFLSTAQRNHTKFTKWLISKMGIVSYQLQKKQQVI